MARAPFMIGAVAAMAREARLVHRATAGAGVGARVIVSSRGIGPQRARAAALSLVDEGVTLLLSTGYAGGLGAGVRVGDLLLPEWVADEDGLASPTWAPGRERLGEALGGSVTTHGGGLTASSRVVASVAEKRALATTSGALGVDMESAAVAAVGRERNIPVLVIRSVSDSADHEVPRAALHATDDSGNVSTLRVLRALVRRPFELHALLRLGVGVRAAEGTLALALERGLPALLRPAAGTPRSPDPDSGLRDPSPRSDRPT